MPWQTIRFLDDAARRILLYKDGGGYRFYVDIFDPSPRSESCRQIALSQNSIPCRTLTTSSIMLSRNSLPKFLRASRAGDAALDRGGRALRAESERGSALMSTIVLRSLSLFESTHPCQGSGLAASLAPRSRHEQPFQ
jgi:hypothetical protein